MPPFYTLTGQCPSYFSTNLSNLGSLLGAVKQLVVPLTPKRPALPFGLKLVCIETQEQPTLTCPWVVRLHSGGRQRDIFDPVQEAEKPCVRRHDGERYRGARPAPHPRIGKHSLPWLENCTASRKSTNATVMKAISRVDKREDVSTS